MVFTWFSSMTATCGLTTWFGIGVTYLRFYSGLRAQNFDRKKLPYTSKLQPYAAWWAVCASALTMFVRIVHPVLPMSSLTVIPVPFPATNLLQQFSAWEVFLRDEWSTATFVTNYLPIMLFPVLYVSAKVFTNVALVKPSEMDFNSGVPEIEAITSVFTLLEQASPL